MPNTVGTQLARSIDWIICKTAKVTFNSIQHFNKRNPNPSVTPQWSDKPLLKSWEKSKPTLGFPRQTDSLCPGCVKEAREAIIAGKKDWRDLMSEKVGEIKAQIIERDGQVWMVKDCPLHGHYEDMMAVDSKWLSWIEKQYPGRDIPAHNDEDLHKHGSSTVLYGRGSVLTVDLTNRCNMMCDPCFMDANQVGYVHELGWDEIKEILDNALKIKPRRQMSVQFSGGEPTMSPNFLEAVAYARKQAPNRPLRHRLEHAYLWNPEAMDRMAELGVIWNTQPVLMEIVGREGVYSQWGDGARFAFLFKFLIKRGVIISGGSDWPVGLYNPLIGIDILVNHRFGPEENSEVLNSDEALSVLQALRVYTYNGAYTAFEEDEKGSLEEGKLADMAVLSDDILSVASTKIREIKIDQTYVDGRLVFDRSN